MRELYGQHISRLNRELGAALEDSGFDALVLHSGNERLISRFDDRYWTFNPTPAFAHLSPIREPGAVIVVRPGESMGLYRPAHTSYWDAPPAPPPEWALASFNETSPESRPTGRVAFISEDLTDLEGWGASPEALNPSPLLEKLDAIRAIKSAYEVESIAAANRVAAAGHQAIAAAFKGSDLSELALHLLYLSVTDQDDVDTPYKGIVALGRNAAVLHHNRYGRKPRGEDGRNMLVDAGAQVRGYAADVTRTYVKGTGDECDAFAALLGAMEGLQQTICSRIAPGLSFEVLHDETHELLAETARDLELASASKEELISSGFTRALLPHGLGHSIGIQVHDVGCKTKPPAERNPYLRNTADVAVGQVFTVEPGCYFIDTLLDPLREAPIAAHIDWRAIDVLRPFGGIRIEDNVAVLPGETRNLTRDNWPDPP